MLGIDAPFPNPGAKALLIHAHQAFPVRIMQRVQPHERTRRNAEELLVSLLDRVGSSGNRRVALADLADASPLSEAELAEMEKLERDLAGSDLTAKGHARKAARYERLRLRAVYADQLAAAERRAQATRFGLGQSRRPRI
ncbi:MAG TPA: hypothetical protein VGX37_03000 [Allosphingosinicella sp.]|jgi:hypothetical protein|nr:hypothetical protein [Allosphingosinicella sp.]